MRFTWVAGLSLGLSWLLLSGCGDDSSDSGADGGEGEGVTEGEGAPAEGEGATELDISICDPVSGAPFTLEIDNPYFPLPVGKKLVLEGTEDSALVRVEFTVLDETEIVAGVTTRVIEERETEDGELVEISRNFFVQAADGSVCYFGEDVDIYEGGQVTGHEGQWRAGENGNLAGILMPANPAAGMSYQQEVAPGIAEDHGEITKMGESLTVPAGSFADTLFVEETSPLDLGTSSKVYVRDIGMAVDEPLQLISY